MNDKKKSILLIDDDSICNSINTIFLKKKLRPDTTPPVEIKAFINPLEALTFLTEILTSENYEKILLLLDINMPEMTGWEFLEEFSKLQKGKTEAVIFILTSSVHKGDIDKADANPDIMGFISKPITSEIVQNLFDVMENADTVGRAR